MVAQKVKSYKQLNTIISMKIVTLRVIVAIIATLVGIIFAILSSVYSANSSLILTVEVILLPAVYIIGNYIGEQMLEDKFQEQISIIDKESKELKDKYIEQVILNRELQVKTNTKIVSEDKNAT